MVVQVISAKAKPIVRWGGKSWILRETARPPESDPAVCLWILCQKHLMKSLCGNMFVKRAHVFGLERVSYPSSGY